MPDLLIAAAAEANDLAVLHYDADFDRIATVTGQRVDWVVPAGSVDRRSVCDVSDDVEARGSRAQSRSIARPIVESMLRKPGDKAPDLTLLDQEGNAFTLSESLNEPKVGHFISIDPLTATYGG